MPRYLCCHQSNCQGLQSLLQGITGLSLILVTGSNDARYNYFNSITEFPDDCTTCFFVVLLHKEYFMPKLSKKSSCFSFSFSRQSCVQLSRLQENYQLVILWLKAQGLKVYTPPPRHILTIQSSKISTSQSNWILLVPGLKCHQGPNGMRTAPERGKRGFGLPLLFSPCEWAEVVEAPCPARLGCPAAL